MYPDSNIILFDGVCNLCNSTVRFIIRHDKKGIFRFAPMQKEPAITLMRASGLRMKNMDSIVYIRANKTYQKSKAVLYILRDLKGLWQLAFACIIMPAFIADFFYDIIAKNRYKVFGKRESCMIPDNEILERFL